MARTKLGVYCKRLSTMQWQRFGATEYEQEQRAKEEICSRCKFKSSFLLWWTTEKTIWRNLRLAWGPGRHICVRNRRGDPFIRHLRRKKLLALRLRVSPPPFPFHLFSLAARPVSPAVWPRGPMRSISPTPPEIFPELMSYHLPVWLIYPQNHARFPTPLPSCRCNPLG
jgi:hypothetical protein